MSNSLQEDSAEYSDVVPASPSGGRPHRPASKTKRGTTGPEASVESSQSLEDVINISRPRKRSAAASHIDSLFDQMKMTDARRHIFPYVKALREKSGQKDVDAPVELRDLQKLACFWKLNKSSDFWSQHSTSESLLRVLYDHAKRHEKDPLPKKENKRPPSKGSEALWSSRKEVVPETKEDLTEPEPSISMGEFSPYKGDLFSTRGSYERGIIYASRRGRRVSSMTEGAQESEGSHTVRDQESTMQSEHDSANVTQMKSQSSSSKHESKYGDGDTGRFNAFEVLRMSSTATLANVSFDEQERKRIAESGAAQTLFETWKSSPNQIIKRNCAITLANVFSTEVFPHDDMLLPIITLSSIDPSLYELLKEVPSTVVRVKEDCQGKEVMAAAAQAIYQRLHSGTTLDIIYLPGILAALTSIIRYKMSDKSTRLKCVESILQSLRVCKETGFDDDPDVDQYIGDYDELEDSSDDINQVAAGNPYSKGGKGTDISEDAYYAPHRTAIENGVVPLIVRMLDTPLMNEKASEDSKTHSTMVKEVCTKILAELMHAPNARSELNNRVVPALLELVSEKNGNEKTRDIAAGVLYEVSISHSAIADDLLGIAAGVEALTRAALRQSKLAALALKHVSETKKHDDKLQCFSHKYYLSTDPIGTEESLTYEIPEWNDMALRTCGALLYMSRDPDLVEILLPCGAADALRLWFDLSNEFSDATVIRELSLLGLANLFEKVQPGSDSAQTLLRLGFTSVMIDVIMNPVSSGEGGSCSEKAEQIRENALQGAPSESRSPTRRCAKALCSLSNSDEDTVTLLLQEGVVDALSEILETTQDIQSRKDSLKALKNLSQRPVSIPWMVNKGEREKESDSGEKFVNLVMDIVPKIEDIEELMDVVDLVCSLSHHEECHSALLAVYSEELLLSQRGVEAAKEEPSLLFSPPRLLQLRICQYYFPERYGDETVEDQYPLSSSIPTGTIDGLLGIDNGRIVGPLELLSRIATLDSPVRHQCMSSLCKLSWHSEAQTSLIRYGFLDLLAFYARAVESSLRRASAQSAYNFTCARNESAVSIDADERRAIARGVEAVSKKYSSASQCPAEEIISSAATALETHRSQHQAECSTRDMQIIVSGVAASLTIGALFRSDDASTKSLCAAALHNLAFEKAARNYLVQEGTLWACVRLALEAEIHAQEASADEEERTAKELGLVSEDLEGDDSYMSYSVAVDDSGVFRDWDDDDSQKPVAGQGRGGKTSRQQLVERQVNWQQTKKSQKLAIMRQRSNTTQASPSSSSDDQDFDYEEEQTTLQKSMSTSSRGNRDTSASLEDGDKDISLISSPMVRAQRLGSRGRFFSTDRVSVDGMSSGVITAQRDDEENYFTFEENEGETGDNKKKPRVVTDENGTRVLCLPERHYSLFDCQLTATRLLRNMMFTTTESNGETVPFYEVVAEKRTIDALVTFASSHHPLVRLDTSVLVANLSLMKSLREPVLKRGILAAVWESLEATDLPISLRCAVTILRLCCNGEAIRTICCTGNNLVPLFDRLLRYCDKMINEWTRDFQYGEETDKRCFLKRHIGAHGGIGTGAWEGFKAGEFLQVSPCRLCNDFDGDIKECGSSLKEEKPSIHCADTRCGDHVRNLFSRIMLALAAILRRLSEVSAAHETLISQGVHGMILHMLRTTKKARGASIFPETLCLAGWEFSDSQEETTTRRLTNPYSRIMTKIVHCLDRLMLVRAAEEPKNMNQINKKLAFVVGGECLGLREGSDEMDDVALDEETHGGLLPYVLRILANITAHENTSKLVKSNATFTILCGTLSGGTEEDDVPQSTSDCIRTLSLQSSSSKIMCNLLAGIKESNELDRSIYETIAAKLHEYSQFWVCQINHFPVQSTLNLAEVFQGDVGSTKEELTMKNACFGHTSCGPLISALTNLVFLDDSKTMQYFSSSHPPPETGTQLPSMSRSTKMMLLNTVETSLPVSVAEVAVMTCALLPRLEVLFFESKDALKDCLLAEAGLKRGSLRSSHSWSPQKKNREISEVHIFDLAQELMNGDVSEETVDRLRMLIPQDDVKDMFDCVLEEIGSDRSGIVENLNENLHEKYRTELVAATYYRKSFHFMRRLQLLSVITITQFTRDELLAQKLVSLDNKQSEQAENSGAPNASGVGVSIVSALGALARWGRPAVSCAASEGIANLSLTADNRAYLLRKRIVPTLASLASQSSTDANTKQWCALTLQHMSLDTSLQDSLVNDARLVKSVLLMTPEEEGGNAENSQMDYNQPDHYGFESDDNAWHMLYGDEYISASNSLFLSEDEATRLHESYLQALIMHEKCFTLGGRFDIMIPPYSDDDANQERDDAEGYNSSGLFLRVAGVSAGESGALWDPDRLPNWEKLQGIRSETSTQESGESAATGDGDEDSLSERMMHAGDSESTATSELTGAEGPVGISQKHARGLTQPFLVQDRGDGGRSNVAERRRYSLEDIAVMRKTNAPMAQALEAAGTVSSEHVVRASGRLGLSSLVLNASSPYHSSNILESLYGNRRTRNAASGSGDGRQTDAALHSSTQRTSEDTTYLAINKHDLGSSSRWETVDVLGEKEEEKEHSFSSYRHSSRMKTRQASQSFLSRPTSNRNHFEGVLLDKSEEASKQRNELAARSFSRKSLATVERDAHEDPVQEPVYSRLISSSRAWADDRNTDREIRRQAALIPLQRQQQMLESIQANIRFTGSAKSSHDPIRKQSLPRNLQQYMQNQKHMIKNVGKKGSRMKGTTLGQRNVKSALQLHKAHRSGTATSLQRSASAFQQARAGTGRKSTAKSSRRSSSRKATSTRSKDRCLPANRSISPQENLRGTGNFLSEQHSSGEANASSYYFDESSFLTSGNADSDPQQ
eukprot:gb/GECG01004924.1/.p1 GENE.gb/GECG01004924.1/~~gb/GECG01004924.1/.p1  ORF type:complete len:2858 (+),score=379.87 gb/GECG01004924.1/:1-8574(+)